MEIPTFNGKKHSQTVSCDRDRDRDLPSPLCQFVILKRRSRRHQNVHLGAIG